MLALYDAWRIRKNIRIRHAINAIAYCGLIFLFYNLLDFYAIVGLLLLRIPVFNTALNIFRGLPADHISYTTTSIIDKYFTNPLIKKIGYWTYNCIVLFVSISLMIVKKGQF